MCKCNVCMLYGNGENPSTGAGRGEVGSRFESKPYCGLWDIVGTVGVGLTA